MAPIINEHKDEIISACDKHNLKYLYVFGSAARGEDFNEMSDIDFLYAFDKEKIPEMSYARNFFDFLYRLEDLFERDIDLVYGEKITNPYLIQQIDSEKVKLYES